MILPANSGDVGGMVAQVSLQYWWRQTDFKCCREFQDLSS
jgi:hypothetical protein